jgi:hypothetical protein
MTKNHQRVVYYAARHPYLDAIKIGTTNNLARRLESLRKKYSEDLDFLAIEFDNHGDSLVYSLESQRHSQFKKSRIVGEWFWLTDDLKQHIENLDLNDLEGLLP